VAIQFQHNYQLLELKPGSDWQTAKKNYRRLVHACHPDRFAQKPRERVHAQQKFIELTKAFNSLRTFHRENHRMPFEQIRHAVADSPEPPPSQRVTTTDETMFKTGILNKRKPSTENLKSSLKPLLWILPTGATIIAGLVVFVIIDRNAKMKTIEEAKRVLHSSEPSQYMRDSEKISQVNSRAVLINKSGSKKMGDKLAKDLFK